MEREAHEHREGRRCAEKAEREHKNKSKVVSDEEHSQISDDDADLGVSWLRRKFSEGVLAGGIFRAAPCRVFRGETYRREYRTNNL